MQGTRYITRWNITIPPLQTSKQAEELANQIEIFLRMVGVSLKYHEPKPIISKILLQIKQDFLTSQVKKYFGDKLFTF